MTAVRRSPPIPCAEAGAVGRPRRRSLAVAALCLAAAPLAARAQPRTPMPAVGIDHLILGVDDLEKGMSEFASKTGVKPMKGGIHPGRGTQNALVGLGNGRYLEILAPSREPGTPADARVAFAALTPSGWALHTDNLGGVIATLRGAAFVVSDARAGARTRPDGAKLAWQAADVGGAGLDAAPFFIQWGQGSAHPSGDAPTGCTLDRVTMTEPDPAPLARFFRAVRVDVPVAKGARRGMTITLACPTGKVTFGS
ncbi:MAG: VOC family protein [Gemmatimonadetes bacterium]|nr:VOC family protein [Gemmatimonadota bacterium]